MRFERGKKEPFLVDEGKKRERKSSAACLKYTALVSKKYLQKMSIIEKKNFLDFYFANPNIAIYFDKPYNSVVIYGKGFL